MSPPDPIPDLPHSGIRLYSYQGQNDPRRTTTLYTRALAPWIGLGAGLLLAIFIPSRVWWAVVAGLAGALVFSLAWVTEQAGNLHFERRLDYAWTQVGDRLEETLILVNDSSLPALGVEIVDGSDLPGYSASGVRVVEARSTRRWRVSGISQQRGIFRLGPTTLHFRDPLGLFHVICHYATSRELLVYPPILPELSTSSLAGGGQGTVSTRQRSPRETASTSTVRDYVPGDPIRRIHWPLSMRHRSLLVRQYDRDTGGLVWLVLDTFQEAQVGQGPESTLEYGVVWAASWAWHLLQSGSGVGLFTTGTEQIVVPPARGTGHLWNIMRVLATIQTQLTYPFADLIRTFGPYRKRGEGLIAITPSTDTAWVEMLAQTPRDAGEQRAILLDAASFGEPQPSANTVLQILLRQQGTPVQVVRRGDAQLARPAVDGGGDWDFFVTGFGKVVVRSRPTKVSS